jgi:hypothetical protein
MLDTGRPIDQRRGDDDAVLLIDHKIAAVADAVVTLKRPSLS